MWWYRAEAVRLATDAEVAALPSSAAPVPAPTRTNQWRVQATTRVYCSLAGEDEDGPLCAHGDIIREDHWSCCGGLVHQAPCTKVCWYTLLHPRSL